LINLLSKKRKASHCWQSFASKILFNYSRLYSRCKSHRTIIDYHSFCWLDWHIDQRTFSDILSSTIIDWRNLTNIILQEMSLCYLNMKNCHSQGYDNGANMIGKQRSKNQN
jgi:hypothetical protein